MDIAALSIGLANQQIRTNAGIAVMKNALGVMETQGAQLQKMIADSSVSKITHPTLGRQIDIMG